MMVRIVEFQPSYSASASSILPSASQNSRAGSVLERLMPIQLKVFDRRKHNTGRSNGFGPIQTPTNSQIEMRHALGRNEAPPRDVARVARHFLSEQLSAHRRDECRPPRSECRRDAWCRPRASANSIVVLIDALDTRTESEPVLAEHRRVERRAIRRGARRSRASRNALLLSDRAACNRDVRRYPSRDNRDHPDRSRPSLVPRRGRA